MGWIYLYNGIELNYDDFDSLKDKNKTGYSVYDFITETNAFLDKNNSRLNLIDGGDEPTNERIIVGYNIDGEEVSKYSTSSFATDLPKFKPFDEFKSDMEILKNHLDISKVIEENYMLHVIHRN